MPLQFLVSLKIKTKYSLSKLIAKGEIVSFKNNLWQIDFITSSALQEFSTKTLLNYLPN